MTDSARTSALYGDEDIAVFTFNSDAGILDLIGEGTITTSVETVENRALMDTSKRPHATIVGHTISFDVSGDTGCLLDFAELAAAKAAVPLVLSYGPTNQFYRAGSFVITNVEESLGEAIRWRVTAECTGDLDFSAS